MNLLKFIVPFFVALFSQNLYVRRNATNMFSMMISPFSCNIGEGGGSEFEQQQTELLEKVKKSSSEIATKVVKEAIQAFENKIQEAKKEQMTQKEFDDFKMEIKEKLDPLKLTKDLKDEIHAKYTELMDIVETHGIEIKRFKVHSNDFGGEKEFTLLSKPKQFKVLLEKAMETDEFKTWVSKDMKGPTSRLDIKAVMSLGSVHTGSIFVTEPVDNIRDIPRMQPHMRDFLAVGQTDETSIAYPYISTYTDVYTLGAQMLTENEEITDVSFASAEATSDVKRLGVSMSVSKRYFRGRSAVIIDHIIAQIPDAMIFKEDVQILFGDGSSSNLTGIISGARTFTLAPTTFAAAAFSTVATWNSGTQSLITFAAAHGLLSGDTLVIANSTNYNGTHTEIILVDATKVIINQAYVAETATSWTGEGRSYWYQQVDDANEFDVLSAAISVMNAGLYNANRIFLNPQTIKKLGILKATDAAYLGVTRDAAGNLNVDGVPIIEMPIIPAGWYLLGDFSQKAIEIREYTPMSVQFLEDVTTKKTNCIVVLADEEIHLVKYNPQWYIFDRFSSALANLETP